MKPISVAVAVAVVLTVVCIQQSSATFFEGRDLVETKNDHSLMEEEESAMGYTTMAYGYDPKRIRCRFCCRCCRLRGCGVCCRWRRVAQDSTKNI